MNLSDKIFWERAFLSMLPLVLKTPGWEKEGPRTMDDVTGVLASYADSALYQWKIRFPEKKEKRTRAKTSTKGLIPAEGSSAEYLSVKSVAKRYDSSEPTIWRRSREEPDFPKPVRLSSCCTRWRLEDLLAWESAQGDLK